MFVAYCRMFKSLMHGFDFQKVTILFFYEIKKQPKNLDLNSNLKKSNLNVGFEI
jgi:hypothetical protein